MNNLLKSVVALLLVGNVAMATWNDMRYDHLEFQNYGMQSEREEPDPCGLEALHDHIVQLQNELRHLDFVHLQCV